MSFVLLWQPSDCIDLFVILSYSRKINMMMMMIALAVKLWLRVVSLCVVETVRRVCASSSDVDECSTGVCDSASSTCLNTLGSYKCLCNSGFEPDQDRCKGLLSDDVSLTTCCCCTVCLCYFTREFARFT